MVRLRNRSRSSDMDSTSTAPFSRRSWICSRRFLIRIAPARRSAGAAQLAHRLQGSASSQQRNTVSSRPGLAWGGSPESVARAARYGLPLVLAIIGGDPRRFVPYVELYHQALEQQGIAYLPVAAHSPGHVAETDKQAREEFWPPYREMINRIGAERGWTPTSRAQFERGIEEGSLYVGSPETVAQKIATTAQALGIARFDMKYSAGPLAHPLLMRSIELYGREVIPRVRELIASV